MKMLSLKIGIVGRTSRRLLILWRIDSIFVVALLWAWFAFPISLSSLWLECVHGFLSSFLCISRFVCLSRHPWGNHFTINKCLKFIFTDCRLVTYRVHKNAKRRWQCPMCPRSYKSKPTLKTHLQLECNVEPQFKCHRCGRPFRHKQNLKKHLLALHKELLKWIEVSLHCLFPFWFSWFSVHWIAVDWSLEMNLHFFKILLTLYFSCVGFICCLVSLLSRMLLLVLDFGKSIWNFYLVKRDACGIR